LIKVKQIRLRTNVKWHVKTFLACDLGIKQNHLMERGYQQTIGHHAVSLKTHHFSWCFSQRTLHKSSYRLRKTTVVAYIRWNLKALRSESTLLLAIRQAGLSGKYQVHRRRTGAAGVRVTESVPGRSVAALYLTAGDTLTLLPAERQVRYSAS
jgi:hypothetical protein